MTPHDRSFVIGLLSILAFVAILIAAGLIGPYLPPLPHR